MFNKEQLDNLLNMQVSRRQFLTHIGAAFLALIGITAFLNNLDKFTQKKASADGYGWSAYSGVPPSSNNQISGAMNSLDKFIGKL